MDFLSTACALLALLSCAAAAFLAWQANESASDARDCADELRKSAALLKAHSMSLDVHHGAIRRIEGKLAAFKQHRYADTDPETNGLDRFDRERPRATQQQPLDPEFEAELALQRAPMAAPGAK